MASNASTENTRMAAATTAKSPFVSVVMPCFNAEATIAASIECVLSQTFTDLELIVVDDGSSDGSAALVQTISARDGRVTLLSQENAGPSVARNRGAEAGSGALVAFLDADDLWLPEHIERHVAAMAADAGVGVSFSPCEVIDVNGRPTGERTRVWARDVALTDVLAGNPTSTCSSLVVRRQVFADAGLMRSDMAYAEDQEWLFRVVASQWRVRGIAQRTVRYRTTPGGLSANTQKMLEGWIAFLEHARRSAPGLVDPHVPYATWQMRSYHARQAIRSGQSSRIARNHFLSALAASPGSAVRSPLKTLALAGACLSPALARRAISLSTSLRHG